TLTVFTSTAIFGSCWPWASLLRSAKSARQASGKSRTKRVDRVRLCLEGTYVIRLRSRLAKDWIRPQANHENHVAADWTQIRANRLRWAPERRESSTREFC